MTLRPIPPSVLAEAMDDPAAIGRHPIRSRERHYIEGAAKDFAGLLLVTCFVVGVIMVALP